MQYGFYIESNFCTSCKVCQIACKDEHDLEVGQLFRKVGTNTTGNVRKVDGAFQQSVCSYNLSMACHHCEHPACVKNCPTGAMNKNTETGIVSVNQGRCIGCQYCTWACPYGAPQYDKTIGKTGKCDLCKERLAKGEEPVCVASCPLSLIHVGDIEELRVKYGNIGVELIGNERGTNPSIVIKPHDKAQVKR